MKPTKVFLRQKKITKGRLSLYLDFYPPLINANTGKQTRREFLGIYVKAKPKTPEERESKKETLILAESIKAQRQITIQKGTYGFAENEINDRDFLAFFKKLCLKRYESKGNYENWMSVYKMLKSFRPEGIKFSELNKRLVEDFKSYLIGLKHLKQNSKVSYYRKFLASIKEAVRADLIKDNPAKNVVSLKEEETKREYLTLDELRKIAAHPCKEPLLKKAFIFSCFTGLRFSDIKNLK